MIVIAIIGILTAIAVPMFMGQREKAKTATLTSNARAMVTEAQLFFDGYVEADPLLLLDAGGAQVCVERTSAVRRVSASLIFTSLI